MDTRGNIKFKDFCQKAMLVTNKNNVKMNGDNIENIRRSTTNNIKL